MCVNILYGVILVNSQVIYLVYPVQLGPGEKMGETRARPNKD